MCRRIRDLIATDIVREWWSRRAQNAMADARLAYPWLTTDGTLLVTGPGDVSTWWTFAGRNVNATLVTALQSRFAGRITHDNLAVVVESGGTPETVHAAIAHVRERRSEELLPDIDPDAVAGLKFVDCMPREQAIHLLQRRSVDHAALRKVLTEPVRFVSSD